MMKKSTIIAVVGKKTNKNKTKIPSWTALVRVIGKEGASEIRRCSAILPLSTDGTGFAKLAIGAGTVRTNPATEWASYAARFQEYRVLAMKVSLVVGALGANPVNELDFVIFSTDRSGALTVPASGGANWANDNPKVFNGVSTDRRLLEYEARAIDLEDQDFSPVGTTITNFAIFLTASGSVSITGVATLFCEWMVEFRGTQ
jgi:hypothetical protein